MAVVAGGKTFRTLDDEMYVVGAKVTEVWSNGRQVYPDYVVLVLEGNHTQRGEKSVTPSNAEVRSGTGKAIYSAGGSFFARVRFLADEGFSWALEEGKLVVKGYRSYEVLGVSATWAGGVSTHGTIGVTWEGESGYEWIVDTRTEYSILHAGAGAATLDGKTSAKFGGSYGVNRYTASYSQSNFCGGGTSYEYEVSSDLRDVATTCSFSPFTGLSVSMPLIVHKKCRYENVSYGGSTYRTWEEDEAVYISANVPIQSAEEDASGGTSVGFDDSIV